MAETPNDPLTAAASLIAQAHDVLVAPSADDPDVEGLLNSLEVCFFAVHRLIRRRQRAGVVPTGD
jgi:hypothetical protein